MAKDIETTRKELLETFPASDLFLDKIWPMWRAGFRSGATCTDYLRTVASFCAISGKSFELCGRPEMQTYVNSQQFMEYSPFTATKKLSALRNLGRLIIENRNYWGLPDYRNPFEEIDNPPREFNVDASRLVGENDIDRLVAAATGNPSLQRVIFLTSRMCLSVSECLNIKPSDFSMHGGRLTLFIPDKQFPRRIAVPEDIAPAVFPSNASLPYLSNSKGKPLSRRTLSRYLDDLCEKAGVGSITPAKLRMTGASMMLAGGCPQEEFLRYTGLSPERLRQLSTGLYEYSEGCDYQRIRVVGPKPDIDEVEVS